MKLILSISLLFVSFLSSASTDASINFQNSNSSEISLYPGGGDKKSRKGKRTNKKRKRACSKWSRKGFAG